MSGKTFYEVFHTVSAFASHVICYVSIDIKGKGGSGVSKILLNGFNIVSALNGCNGVGVAQVVESGIRATDTGNNTLESIIGRSVRQETTQLVGEY